MTRHQFVSDPHAAVALRENLEWLADAWTDLLDRLGREQPAPDGQPRPATRSVGLVINERVSELMREVTGFASELVNQLAAEAAEFRLLRDHDTPALLVAAAGRVGHFTEHADPAISRGVPERAALLRRQVTRAAYPDGIRTVHLAAYRCPERLMDEDGRHVACLGHWTIRPLPSGGLGNMICSADPEHVTPPYLWLRIVRRRARLDQTADDLVRVIASGTPGRPGEPRSAPAGSRAGKSPTAALGGVSWLLDGDSGRRVG